MIPPDAFHLFRIVGRCPVDSTASPDTFAYAVRIRHVTARSLVEAVAMFESSCLGFEVYEVWREDDAESPLLMAVVTEPSAL